MMKSKIKIIDISNEIEASTAAYISCYHPQGNFTEEVIQIQLIGPCEIWMKF